MTEYVLFYTYKEYSMGKLKESGSSPQAKSPCHFTHIFVLPGLLCKNMGNDNAKSPKQPEFLVKDKSTP